MPDTVENKTETTSNNETKAAAAAPPSANTIASLFVKKYYTLLSTQPDQIHRFYKQESSFTFSSEGGKGEVVKGEQEIGQKIAALDPEGVAVDITHLEAQKSLEGGLFVLVTGLFTKGASKKNFVETFFLAPQQAGFYVLNDIRFERSGEAAAAVANGVESVAEQKPAPSKKTETAPAPAAEKPKTEAAPAPAPAPAAEKPKTEAAPAPAAAPAATPAPAQAQAPAPAPAAEKPKTETTTAPQTAAKPSKQSAKQAKSAAAPTPAAPPAAAPETTPTPAPEPVKPSAPKSFLSAVKDGAAAPAPAPAQAQQPKPKPAARKAPAAEPAPKHNKEKDDAASVFVRSLPVVNESQVKELEGKIRDLFSKQGPIKNIDPKVLRGFAFVEFESTETAKKCIELGAQNYFTIDGKVLMVEEKKKNADVSKDKSAARGKHPNPNKGSNASGDKTQNTRNTQRERGGNGTQQSKSTTNTQRK